MGNIEIRQPDLGELTKVQQLRHVVLDPARLVKTDHELTPEDFVEEAIHMAAYESENVVGTVRLDLVGVEPNTYEVRKLAVDPIARRRGVGKLVLEAAMTEAQFHGAAVFTLDARKEAIPFFEKLGFSLSGEFIVHADGVPNYVMRRAAAVIK